ncbi:MAG: hypothetical protein SPF92_06545 [Clostridia bacterium]|nr:hypothetical protein [Clostridia bacterium]
MNNIQKSVLEEKHSNAMLLSTVVSMALLTFIFFVYTRLFGQIGAVLPLYNTLLILSFASWVISAVFAVLSLKKSEFFAEYSLLFSILTVCFFSMRGVPFISAKNAAIVTIALIVLYWVLSFAYHSFWQKFTLSKKAQTALVLAFLAVSAILIVVFIVSLAKMPYFNLWYTKDLY